jgi:tetratricopeptide (TPR) repeat protein
MSALMASVALPAAAEPVQRSEPVAGAVIARKVGEEIRFFDVASWRIVDLSQEVVSGDYLRTNANGSLAVLFADQTQMRLGRNTTLLVKHASANADASFTLESGTIWARAARQGLGLTVDTPAAAAAIRGTDWTMSVDADGKTSLTVLEGSVELSNPQGSVTVGAGEAAVAAIGQAPTKIINVNPNDREQMLFYLSLRGAFTLLPVSTLPTREMRTELERINARPEASRSAEDWVTLAEVNLSYAGRAAALADAEEARRHPLTATQKARLDFLDAMVAGAEQRYEDAARLFASAAPRLDARRRAVALYGGYYSRALTDPSRVEAPPRGLAAGPYAAIAEAYTAGFLVDLKAAIEVIARAEQLYPYESTLPAIRAQIAMLLDDREQAQAAVERSLSLDPDDSTALEARANLRSDLNGDLDGAYADLQRAIALTPGSTSAWNDLGLVQSSRGADREAEAALKHSIDLDPQDPVAHINLAIVYLDQNRVAEAKEEIDRAMAADPSFDLGYVLRGRYHLQTGDTQAALADLLAGTTANPAYAQGLLLLAAGYYMAGDRVLSEQALDNADRLDANDPVVSSFRTAVAIDDYEADAAIINAQEALRRTRARGGDFSALSANRDTGSTLNDAFRLLGLDAWGRYYGDAVFDPFTASGYIDQAVSGSPSPFFNNLRFGELNADPRGNALSFSGFFQGLMLDPQLLASSSRQATLLRTPFLEATLGGGFVADTGSPGWTGQVEVQGYQPSPFPVSFYAQVNGIETDTEQGTDTASGLLGLENRTITGSGFLGFEPTPYDRVVAYVESSDVRDDLTAIPDPIALPLGADLSDDGTTRSTNVGLAWSHTFGYQNIGNLAFFYNDVDQTSLSTRLFETGLGPFGTVSDTSLDQTTYLAAASHAFAVGDLAVRYGAEGGEIDSGRADTLTLYIPTVPTTSASQSSQSDVPFARLYVDGLYDVNPNLKVEAGLFGTILGGDALDEQRLEPRVGLAWTPTEGQYLRAGYLREPSTINFATLAPIGVVGLQSNQVGLSPDGYSDTFAARWDAEWTSRLFTSVDYQHQDLSQLSLAVPASATTLDLSQGRIDRVAATANFWIGGGLGAFATLAYTDSENEDPLSPGYGLALPFVPDFAARAGFTYVNPANVKVSIWASYVGDRIGDDVGTELDPFWTLDGALTWEPFDKRFELDLAAYNLLDEDFQVAANTPGWGRTIVGTLKVRF